MKGPKHDHTARGISPVIGVAVMVAIVVLLVAVTALGVVNLAQSEVSSTDAQAIGQYEFDIEDTGGDSVVIRPQAVSKLGEDPTFHVRVNDERVHEWGGQGEVELSCLYPGDKVTITTSSGTTGSILQTEYFDRTTDCDRYNSFPEKFSHVVVNGTEHEVSERYAFGLAIEPNGDDPANGINLGPISLSNRWHYVEQYDREVEGLEPPVFVAVMVDNVHWNDVPDPSAHSEVPAGQQYNWTDDPPSGLAPGENSVTVQSDGTLVTDSSSSTEPTNDVFLVFKPGCEGSRLKFIKNDAGYDNRIYLDGSVIVDDANAATEGQVFTAPGVECRGDASW